jgi:hypothetical protein
MEGVCETESCHGKADPEVNEWDDNPDNEASIRVTICHRTCAENNPWVRITIDDDAWNGTAASGCGHMEQHDVGIEDCPGKDNYDAWGETHRRDYLIMWHGTRDLLAAQNGWSDLTCNGGSGKCAPSSDEEKDYWFYWERACPSVRNGACCGNEELGACCGDDPYPLLSSAPSATPTGSPPAPTLPPAEDIPPPPTPGPTTSCSECSCQPNEMKCNNFADTGGCYFDGNDCHDGGDPDGLHSGATPGPGK